MMKTTNYFLLCCLLTACGGLGTPDSKKGATDSTQQQTVTNPTTDVPMFRDTVRKEAVAQYRVKTDNPLNDWYFAVAIYETPKTFHYLVKLQFEEITGKDTLKLPNFGKLPEPVIRKGPSAYSCIIGFMDKDNQFREYKKVFVKNNHLKITALKHYAVATYQQ